MSGRGPLLVVPVLAACVLLGTRPAGAFHINGATYTGTISRGGAITLTVSADRVAIVSVTNVIGTGVAGAACSMAGAQLTNLRITNHTFNGETAAGGPPGAVHMIIAGTFSAPGTANGSISVTQSTPCDTGTGVTWSASTQAATPTPSPLPTLTPVPTPVPTRRNGLPPTGMNTTVYGFSGLGLVFLGLSFVTLTYRKRPEFAVRTTPSSPIHRTLPVDERPYDGEYKLTGWIPLRFPKG